MAKFIRIKKRYINLENVTFFCWDEHNEKIQIWFVSGEDDYIELPMTLYEFGLWCSILSDWGVRWQHD